MTHKKRSRFTQEFSDFYFTEKDLNGQVVNCFTRKIATRFADIAKSLQTPCHIHSVYTINFVDTYQTDENGLHPIVHIVEKPIDFYIVNDEDELNKVLEQTKDTKVKVVNKQLHPMHPKQDCFVDMGIWCFLHRIENTKKHVR